jgi:hypothetical protein
MNIYDKSREFGVYLVHFKYNFRPCVTFPEHLKIYVSKCKVLSLTKIKRDKTRACHLSCRKWSRFRYGLACEVDAFSSDSISWMQILFWNPNHDQIGVPVKSTLDKWFYACTLGSGMAKVDSHTQTDTRHKTQVSHKTCSVYYKPLPWSGRKRDQTPLVFNIVESHAEP